MSTRVQKGNTTFKPVAKPRARASAGTSSRLSSTQPESASSRKSVTPAPTVGHDATSPVVSRSMGPPAVVPIRPSLEPAGNTTQDRPTTHSSQARMPDISISPSEQTFSEVVRQPAPIPIPSQSDRNTPILVPPESVHLSRSLPNSEPTTSAVVEDSTSASSQDHVQKPAQTEAGSSTNFQPLQGSAPSNPVPESASGDPANRRVALNAESSLKGRPKRPGPQRKYTVNVGDGATSSEGGRTSDGSPARKRRRPTVRTRKSSVATNASDSAHDGQDAPVIKRRRKSRSKSAASQAVDGVSDAEGSMSASSSAPESTVLKKRRGRGRLPSPSYDPLADPGEAPDPTAVTMSTLCEDPGVGRVSSRAEEVRAGHVAWRAKNRARRARMRSLMEARKLGREEEDADPESANRTKELEARARSSAPSVRPGLSTSPSRLSTPGGGSGDEGHVDTSGQGFDYNQTLTAQRFTARVRIGAGGSIALDDTSLAVDAREGEGEEATQHYEHVEETEASVFSNSAAHSKRFRGSRWSAEETELFFDALQRYGENYELIALSLPGRDRKACKGKFKAEDKRNSARIDYCLNHRIPYDIQNLARVTGKDFSGPTPEIRPRPPLSLKETDQPEPPNEQPDGQNEENSGDDLGVEKDDSTPVDGLSLAALVDEGG